MGQERRQVINYAELYRRAQEDTLLDLLMAGEITGLQGFLAKRVLQVGDCWEWQGVMHRTGYGCFRQHGKFQYAHRASYEAFHGPIGDLLICHRCDNPKCIHPDHLFLGTHEENMADMKAKGRGRNQY